jgi:predicted RNase H-like HicB family nuclease
MSAGERITLHVELADILPGHQAGLSLSDLADRVNRRRRCRKRDRSDVKASQVRLRARKYDHLFEIEDERVTLRQPETPQPEYPVRLSPLAKAEGGGWLAEVPDLPGCISDGQTREEAIHNAEDAISAWIATTREFDHTVPLRGSGDRHSGR